MAVGDKLYLGLLLDTDNNQYKAIMKESLDGTDSIPGVVPYAILKDEYYLYCVGRSEINKINKQTFQVEKTLTGDFDVDMNNMNSVAEDESYIYVPSGLTLLKISKSTLTIEAQKPDSNDREILGITVDENYVYFTSNYQYNFLTKLLKSDMSVVSRVSYQKSPGAMTSDLEFLYVLNKTDNKVDKFKKSDLSLVASSPVISTFTKHYMFTENGFIYLTRPLMKLKADDLTVVQTGLNGTIIDVDSYYFYLLDGSRTVHQINKSDISNSIKSVQLDANLTGTVTTMTKVNEFYYASISGLRKIKPVYRTFAYERVELT